MKAANSTFSAIGYRMKAVSMFHRVNHQSFFLNIDLEHTLWDFCYGPYIFDYICHN